MLTPTRSSFFYLVIGVLLGTLVAAGGLLAQNRNGVPDVAGQPFDIVDTPGSTYLLNKSNGTVWRLSFTDVGGNKYWYAMHVPMQQPGSFEDFQTKLRRELAAPKAP